MSKALVVTGGGRGIGAATARLAAARGWAVCVNYRRERAAAEGVVADIARAGGRAVAVAADVVLRGRRGAPVRDAPSASSGRSRGWSTTPGSWSARRAWRTWTRRA